MASVVKERRSRRGITYRVDFRDRSGQRAGKRGKLYALRGFEYKPAADKVRANISRLEQLRGTGERPDPDLMRWVNELPAAWRAKLERAELLDSRAVAALKPLADHVDDYHQALLDRGGTAKHARLTKTWIMASVDGIGATSLCHLDAAAVARYLAGRREKTRKDGGLSVASSNHYLRALKGFCTWLVKERRALESPVAHLMMMMNAATDKQRERRPLDAEELGLLIEATERGPAWRGMTGPDRAVLYRVASGTGFRVSEVGYQARTENGSLRHPRFLRWRDDLARATTNRKPRHIAPVRNRCRTAAFA